MILYVIIEINLGFETVFKKQDKQSHRWDKKKQRVEVGQQLMLGSLPSVVKPGAFCWDPLTTTHSHSPSVPGES